MYDSCLHRILQAVAAAAEQRLLDLKEEIDQTLQQVRQ